MPAFRCGIHFYVLTNYKTPKKYDELLKSVDSQFSINCHSIDGFDDLVKLFHENEDASKMIASKEEYLESSVMCYVGNIVNRYLYVTRKFTEGEIEVDEIEVSDRISIFRMTEEFQISRFNAMHFESTQENNLVQCAAYMIRLNEYSVENKDKESLHNAASNYWAYPLELYLDIKSFEATLDQSIGEAKK